MERKQFRQWRRKPFFREGDGPWDEQEETDAEQGAADGREKQQTRFRVQRRQEDDDRNQGEEQNAEETGQEQLAG